jgi:hypothetical protein
MGEIRHAHIKFRPENLTERNHLVDLGVDGRISERILRKEGGTVWTGFRWLMTGTNGGIL